MAADMDRTEVYPVQRLSAIVADLYYTYSIVDWSDPKILDLKEKVHAVNKNLSKW